MANLREEIASAMKNALKAKDQAALATMRLISAALKDRDIAARGNGNQDGIGDDEILSMMQTMIKQRTDSAKMYRDGNRPELAEAEEAEVEDAEEGRRRQKRRRRKRRVDPDAFPDLPVKPRKIAKESPEEPKKVQRTDGTNRRICMTIWF